MHHPAPRIHASSAYPSPFAAAGRRPRRRSGFFCGGEPELRDADQADLQGALHPLPRRGRQTEGWHRPAPASDDGREDRGRRAGPNARTSGAQRDDQTHPRRRDAEEGEEDAGGPGGVARSLDRRRRQDQRSRTYWRHSARRLRLRQRPQILVFPAGLETRRTEVRRRAGTRPHRRVRPREAQGQGARFRA